MGMLESTKINFVALLDLFQHLLDIGCRKCILSCAPNGLQLRLGFAYRPARASFPEHPANPLSNGYVLAAGGPLDFCHFLVW